MPIPHDVMRRKIKDRLIGKEPQDKLRVLQESLLELPGYFQGPYGELRRWIKDEIAHLEVRVSVRHQDVFAVKKEGHCQIAVVGPPNAGKSSLLKWLTGRQVAVGDYTFTTLKPVAAIYLIRGAQVQLVEIPGILEGAKHGRGNGKALLSCARNSDSALLAVPLCPEVGAIVRQLWDECGESLAQKTLGLVLTKKDVDKDGRYKDLALEATRCLPVNLQDIAEVSVEGDYGRSNLDDVLWQISGLIRIFTKGSDSPVILPAGSTTKDLAFEIHKHLATTVKSARVTGPSARFPNQTVGPDHVLHDTDAVDLDIRREK